MPVAPVGRMAKAACDVLTVTAWIAQLLQDIRASSEVVIGSYTFDHGALTSLLVQRLSSRARPFCATVLVDRDQLTERTCVGMRPRLAELFAAGATVVLCRGAGRFGRFHMKAAVVDRRVGYTGSCNFTEKSINYNAELVVRLAGPPVLDVLAELERAKRGGVEWDGA